jgi:hypothetical protein
MECSRQVPRQKSGEVAGRKFSCLIFIFAFVLTVSPPKKIFLAGNSNSDS